MDAKIQNYVGWQSDVIVDLIKRYDFPYITLNPGASFRGLHDSLVNYGHNEPPMMLCNHEEIAVQIAHGYAKATGKPAAVILHNLVGLLHACMAIYYAYRSEERRVGKECRAGWGPCELRKNNIR